METTQKDTKVITQKENDSKTQTNISSKRHRNCMVNAQLGHIIVWMFLCNLGMDGFDYVWVEACLNEKNPSQIFMWQMHYNGRKEVAILWSPPNWTPCVLPTTTNFLSIAKTKPR